jgi:hypothetical protein
MKASLATTPARSVIGHLNGRSLNKVSRLDLVKPSTDPPLAARGTFGTVHGPMGLRVKGHFQGAVDTSHVWNSFSFHCPTGSADPQES